MAEPSRQDVTLATLHEDLTAGVAETRGMRVEMGGMRAEMGGMRAEMGEMRTEMRAGFADLKTTMTEGFRDLKATMIQGFAGLPTRESSEEMVRLLRENNRLQETRFTQLDVALRAQHLETQQTLHALAEGQRTLVDEHRLLSGEVRNLVARIDALIRGRGDGSPAAG
jgi:hypothetical protein